MFEFKSQIEPGKHYSIQAETDDEALYKRMQNEAQLCIDLHQLKANGLKLGKIDSPLTVRLDYRWARALKDMCNDESRCECCPILMTCASCPEPNPGDWDINAMILEDMP